MLENNYPVWKSDDGKREFAAFPVAVVGFIINDAREFLMFRLPGDDGWEVVCGKLEAEETPLEGVMRECREEAGSNLILKPLGAFHAYSFQYDTAIQKLLCLAFLLKYESGEPAPGDDMQGAEFRWIALSQILSAQVPVKVPVKYNELFMRAASVFEDWQQQEFRVEYREGKDEG